MELKIALAKIKMLEEQNRHLTELVQFYLSKPLPSAIEYQKLLQESQPKPLAKEAASGSTDV